MKAAMLERTKDSNKVREDITKLIYLYLATHDFFRHFPVKKKKSLPACWEASCLYIQWCAYVDAICKEGLRKKCVFAPNLLYTVEK